MLEGERKTSRIKSKTKIACSHAPHSNRNKGENWFRSLWGCYRVIVLKTKLENTKLATISV